MFTGLCVAMPNPSLCCLQGAIMVGILFVTIISWIPGHAASYLGSRGDYSGRQLSALQTTCTLHPGGVEALHVGQHTLPQPSCSLWLRGRQPAISSGWFTTLQCVGVAVQVFVPALCSLAAALHVNHGACGCWQRASVALPAALFRQQA